MSRPAQVSRKQEPQVFVAINPLHWISQNFRGLDGTVVGCFLDTVMYLHFPALND